MDEVVGGWLMRTEDPGIGAELPMNCWELCRRLPHRCFVDREPAPLLLRLECARA